MCEIPHTRSEYSIIFLFFFFQFRWRTNQILWQCNAIYIYKKDTYISSRFHNMLDYQWKFHNNRANISFFLLFSIVVYLSFAWNGILKWHDKRKFIRIMGNAYSSKVKQFRWNEEINRILYQFKWRHFIERNLFFVYIWYDAKKNRNQNYILYWFVYSIRCHIVTLA